MKLLKNIVAALKSGIDLLFGSEYAVNRFHYYIVTPRQGRHTIRRKLLRQIPRRLN